MLFWGKISASSDLSVLNQWRTFIAIFEKRNFFRALRLGN